jgi:hypothetical protein
MASMPTLMGTAMRPLLLALVLAAAPAFAATPSDLLADFASQAKKDSPAFAGFSADRGRAFFTAAHGKPWRCDTCHGADPARSGKHTVTGKVIAPLAPAANPDRFANLDKAEKWFKRNCGDVVGRPCTPIEKGDVLAWLATVK